MKSCATDSQIQEFYQLGTESKMNRQSEANLDCEKTKHGSKILHHFMYDTVKEVDVEM